MCKKNTIKGGFYKIRTATAMITQLIFISYGHSSEETKTSI